MSILSGLWGRITGGWKTYGPNQISGNGALALDVNDAYGAVEATAALRLTAFLAALRLRAETIGSLPLHVRDGEKNIIRDHDLYDVIHNSPNSMMTAPEFWSMAVANLDMHGNSISVVERRTRDSSVISLEPVCPTLVTLKENRGRWWYEIDGEKFDPDNVLHLRGFTPKGLWGLGKLALGRQVLAAQISANDFAMRGFKQGAKVGGFMGIKTDGQNLTEEQVKTLQQRLEGASRPENAGKWITLFKGIEPIPGATFAIKPVDAELLTSRYFGVEEICRLMQVPPQLIGHSDKASSWASSLENVNLHFLMYSLQPTFVGIERRVVKTLLSRRDRTRGVDAKFNIGSLLRSDMKTQTQMFASALQNGYYNRNEVRDLLDRGNIAGGEEFTIQTNMTTASNLNREEPQA